MMNVRIALWMVFFCLCVMHRGAVAGHVLPLDETADRHFVGYYTEFLKGFENDSLASTLANPASAWQSLNRSSVVLGYTSTPYWFRLQVAPHSRPGRWFLELDWPQLDNVDVYFVNEAGSVIAAYVTGDRLPFSARPVDHPHFVYPVPAGTDSVINVYFRVKTDSLFYFTPLVWNELEARDDGLFYLLGSAKAEFWQALFLGLLTTMTLYNVAMFFVNRDVAYLAFSGYSLAFTLYQCSLHGMGHKYLWGDWVDFDGKSYMVFAFLSYASATLFIAKFLRLKENGHRMLDMTAKILSAVWVISVLLCFAFKESAVISATAPLALFTCVMGIWVPFHTWRKNDVFGLYFLIAWSCLLVGTVSYVFLQTGVVEANWFTLLGGQQLGGAIETVVISLALAHRSKALRENTLNSQERLLSYVRNYSLTLEHKLGVRQDELLETGNALTVVRQQLSEREKTQSIDMLTNDLYNELSRPRERLISDLNVIRQKTMELTRFVMELLKQEDDAEVELALREALDALVRPMEVMSTGHFRIADLLQQMRDARDVAKGDKTDVCLREILSNAVSRVAMHYPQVKCTWAGVLDTTIRGWPSGLEEAFLQIAKNAFQAASARKGVGDMVVAPEVIISMAINEDHVFVVIADNGNGMDESIRDRIFDPFFTTRPAGEGAGLGLTMARDMVDRHEGAIECVTSGLGGTRMLVRFPL